MLKAAMDELELDYFGSREGEAAFLRTKLTCKLKQHL